MKDTTILPEGYKQTKVGVIPVEWEVSEISQICDVLLSGVDKKSDPEETPVLLCNYMDVLNNECISSDLQFMRATAKDHEIEKFTLQKNDVLLTKDSETKEDIASSATVIEKLEGVVCGYHLAILRPFKPVDGVYLSKALSSPNIHKQFVNATNGITRFGLTLPTINGVQVYYPPLPEQHRIATILSTVDAAIAATDEVIAKTEDIKRGLMQDLLTKGIDEEGRVRSEETHVFCEKQGMQVPVEWHPTKMKDCLREIKDKSYPPHSEVPYLGLEHLDSGAMKVNGSGDSSLVQSNCSVFKEGNILYGKLRPYLDKAIISPFEGICSTEIVVMDAKENSMNQFLIYHIHSDDFVGYNVSHAFGTKMPRTSFNIIKEYLLPLPPLPEQHRIAAVLSTVDRDLAAERARRAHLQTLKKGLMQDLLTGRTRVPLNGGAPHGA